MWWPRPTAFGLSSLSARRRSGFSWTRSGAEQRNLEGEVLAAALGGLTMEKLRSTARAAAPGDQRPLLLIDDGDEDARVVIARDLSEIGDDGLVLIVTESPQSWRDLVVGLRHEHLVGATSVAPYVPDAIEEEDRPWFMSR